MATRAMDKVDYSLVNVGTVKLERNTDKDPFYTSILVCQEKIIVLDISVNKVHIHRQNDGKFLATLDRLGSIPCDMCLMDARTICVLHKDGLITMVAISSTDMSPVFITTMSLRIQGLFSRYDGVVGFNDKLVVSSLKEDTMCWCIVSLDDGHVDAIHKICQLSEWSYVTTRDNIIYISCYAGYKSPDTGVYGFDILNSNQCKYTYKHQRLEWPTSIVVNEDGDIFVCNYGLIGVSCIHQLTASCKLVAIFTQGVPWRLTSIFWDHGRLFDTSWGSNVITVLQPVYQDNLTEDRIRHLLSSETDLKAYISDNPPEACIKILLSRASKRSSKESMTIILHFIVQQFTERFSEKHIRIWAGEEVIGPENVQTVLVCFYFGSCDISMESFYDLKVIYRDYNTTDGKSALARAHELDIKSDLTPEYCDLVNEAITIHGEGLFAKHSNLEAISSSGIISSHSRGFVQEPCVILYCRVKGILPFGEMPFPKRLKVNEEVSIAVDVREGYFSFHADSQNNGQENTFNHESKMLKEPLRMGCSIGPAGRCESGTVGPFVKINTDRIGFLTCAHVVFCDSELLYLANITQTDPIVKEIVQPPDGDFAASHYQYNHRLCGKVYSAMFCGDWSPSPADKFGIDAAVIEITSRFPNAGEFVQIEETQLEDAGFSLDQPPKFDTGEIMPHPFNRKIQRVVIKIGSETGLTRGLLRLTKGMVRYSISTETLKRDKDRIEEIKITMHGLMEISSASRNKTAFCTYGDSGSGVFLVDDDDNKNKLICVGLSFGVLSDGTGLAMPIDKILTALCRDDDLQIKLNDFENEAFV